MISHYTQKHSDNLEIAHQLLIQISARKTWHLSVFHKLVRQFPKQDGAFFSKSELVSLYQQLVAERRIMPNEQLLTRIRMKPQRTLSGVAPVTVLTKPFPCPGKCIFCPSDIRMPKSYLSDEPGAQRAERNYFDPYLQTYNRLQALSEIGHHTDKVEIIVLGGTWSYYPESYQLWFIAECFRALNDFGHLDGRPSRLEWYHQVRKKLQNNQYYAHSAEPEQNKTALADRNIDASKLEKSYNQVISELYVAPEKKLGLDQYQVASWAELAIEHRRNEISKHRCVGLVVETRPDNISETEVIRMRRLGCTKAQIGFQSLNDDVLAKNHRGHRVDATRRAVVLLRQAGFKIHAHWMANLYGSSVELDKQDYQTLFADPAFKPDELKVYPCSLIQSAELIQYFERGEWQPYSRDELLEVISFALETTPEYCRLTRIIRDIPSTDIVVGNKTTNFRQLAEQAVAKPKQRDIRAREIRSGQIDLAQLQIEPMWYETTVGQEVFVQALAPSLIDVADLRLLGFVRLSLPTTTSFIPELAGEAVIREVHVYGPVAQLGQISGRKTQHLGLGKKLIQQAKEIARQHGFSSLAVISAVGTREYYRSLGFTDGQLYQHLDL